MREDPETLAAGIGAPQASAAPGSRRGTKSGESPEPAGRLERLTALVGPRDCTACVVGESGVGKEVTARRLHELSARRDGPFVPVDCATAAGPLFESQLFGHVKGAFTGADRETLGFFRTADGGTLLLDEVGELDLESQAKLLRVVQDGTVTPVGATRPVSVNVRILAATNRDLGEMAARGRFREDLLFRINPVQIEVPPLRSSPERIGPLAERFLAQQASMYGEPVKRLSEAALQMLLNHDWPGNVRELANAMEHAVVMSGERRRIEPGALPGALGRANRCEPPEAEGSALVSLDEAERQHVARALCAAGGNQSEAARLLRIDRRRLYRLVGRHQLQPLRRSTNGR